MATVLLPSWPIIEVLETDSLSPSMICCNLSSIPLESESDQKSYHHPNSIVGGPESRGEKSGDLSLSSHWKTSQNEAISPSPLFDSSNESSCTEEKFPEAIPTEVSRTSTINAARIGLIASSLFDMALVESQTNGLYNSNLSKPQN